MKYLYKNTLFLTLLALALFISASCADNQINQEQTVELENAEPATPIISELELQGGDTQFVLGATQGKKFRTYYIAPAEDNENDDYSSIWDNDEDYPYISTPDRERGKSRNRYHNYTAEDMEDLTQEHFFMLHSGMSLAEICDIFTTAEIETRSSVSTTFKNDAIEITIGFDDNDQLEYARYWDHYRLCAEESDLSMEKFLQLEIGMRLKDVEDILGGAYYKSHLTYAHNIFTWYNEEAEIQVVTDLTGAVVLVKQEGLQYAPNDRVKYNSLGDAVPTLTNQQLLDNFHGIKLGLDYAQLEELFIEYLPLYNSKLVADFAGNTCLKEYYTLYKHFGPGYNDQFVHLEFVFWDGKLWRKDADRFPEDFLPTTRLSEAKKIKAGLTYDEVKTILGTGGYNSFTEKNKIWDEGIHEEYCWSLPAEGSGADLIVQFFNGKIMDETDITINTL